MALTVVRNSRPNLKKKYRNHCPPHRINDIDALVKKHKGDEHKIMLAIQEWWEEEPEKLEEWQDVNKKLPKKAVYRNDRSSGDRRERGGRNGPYRSSGGGRGFSGRGMGGGRGSGAERRSRDFGGDRNGRSNGGEQQLQQTRGGPPTLVETKPEVIDKFGIPAPVTNVPRLKGAWGHSASHNAAASATLDETENAELKTPEKDVDVGTVTDLDPTPAGFADPLDPISAVILDNNEITFSNSPPLAATRPAAPAPTTGNVWATKGSAHLIQQEAVKQKPPPPRQPLAVEGKPRRDRGASRNHHANKQQSQPSPEQDIIPDSTPLIAVDSIISQDALEVPSSVDPLSIPAPIPAPSEGLESMLPTSTSAANVNANGWNLCTEPESTGIATQQEIPQPDVGSVSLSPLMAEPSAIVENNPVEEMSSVLSVEVAPIDNAMSEEDEPAPEPAEQLPATTVSMGRWDVSAGEDDGLDFGFGSFGNDNENEIDEDSEVVEETHVPIVEPPPAPPVQQVAPPPAHSEIADPAAALAASLSPPRPPPGLTIGGMPPMPANAVSVHELEKKMESVSIQHAEEASKNNVDVPNSTTSALSSSNGVGSSLTEKKNVSNDPSAASQSTQQQPPHVISTSQPDSSNNPTLANQSYAASYGMGMYNYNGAANVGNGFMGIHAPNGTVLGSVLPQQQQPQQKLQQQSTSASQPQNVQAPQHLHQAQQPQVGLYGVAPTSSATTGASGSEGPTVNTGDSASATPGIPPPGMPAAMPYNPNPMFYGQQYYQMGQPHGGVGYGHGAYGQFNNAVQSGFGYQQVMGQNGGYAQPYDDTPQQHHGSHSTHHNNNSHQTYQKNSHSGGSGGYRGRNAHHNNHHNSHHGTHNSGGHQYQNQYNPQHGGYGAQPYNMAYGVDQFGHRAGYVHGNMDPYAMQQNTAGYQSGGVGHSSGGFAQDDSDQQLPHSKGKSKGGNNRANNNGFSSGNPNMQQFQQQVPHQQQQGAQGQQQQGFGFQGNVSDSSTGGGGGGGGASNAGWSNPGWAGGASWQGN